MAPRAIRYYGLANEMDMQLPWMDPAKTYCTLFPYPRPLPWGPGDNATHIYETYIRAARRALDEEPGVADVGLLSTDQGDGCHITPGSPEARNWTGPAHWQSVHWAVQSIDDVSAIYGGHHYPSGAADAARATNTSFYTAWAAQVNATVVDVRAHTPAKGFVVGETGGKGVADGPGHGRCGTITGPDYFQEGADGSPSADLPYAALMLAEQVAGVVNGGGAGLAFWTFFDDRVDATAGVNGNCLWWGLNRHARRT